MENINQIIAYLLAIQNYAKDIHYNCKGLAFYAQHQLADRIFEELDDFQDALKETCLLGNDLLPLPSTEYLSKARFLIPSINEDTAQNFQSMKRLLTEALSVIENTQGTTRGEQSLLDSIAENLQQKLGLVNRQVKNG